MLSQRELELALRRATYMCLGLPPPEGEEPLRCRVRISWPSGPADANLPEWGREENVCFLRVASAPDPYSSHLHSTYGDSANGFAEAVEYTRVHQAHWILYGPDAPGDADLIRASICRDSVRRALRAYSLYPVPGAPEAQRAPELINGAWWERCDLFLRFYEGARREFRADRISAPPRVRTEWR